MLLFNLLLVNSGDKTMIFNPFSESFEFFDELYYDDNRSKVIDARRDQDWEDWREEDEEYLDKSETYRD